MSSILNVFDSLTHMASNKGNWHLDYTPVGVWVLNIADAKKILMTLTNLARWS